MTQEQTDKMKIRLAIYKGLPDAERKKALYEWRTIPGHEARTLVQLCEQYEMSVQMERQQMSALRMELSDLRRQLEARTFVQPDIPVHYGQVRNPESSRAAFGIGVLFAGVGGVYWACSSFGVWPVAIGSAIILALANFSSNRGSGDSDVERKSAEAGHTVVVNVNVGNGQGTAQNGV